MESYVSQMLHDESLEWLPFKNSLAIQNHAAAAATASTRAQQGKQAASGKGGRGGKAGALGSGGGSPGGGGGGGGLGGDSEHTVVTMVERAVKGPMEALGRGILEAMDRKLQALEAASTQRAMSPERGGDFDADESLDGRAPALSRARSWSSY